MLRRCLRLSDAVFFVIAFLITPLLITCFSYFWKTTRQSRNKVRTFRQNQGARFSRAIFTVTASSFLAWMLSSCVLSSWVCRPKRSFLRRQFIDLLFWFNLAIPLLTLLSTFLDFLVIGKLCLPVSPVSAEPRP